MWRPNARAEAAALSRYWNALVRGVPEAELAPLAAELDAGRRSVIARLRGRPRYAPDPAFVARLERDLLRDLAPAYQDAVPLDLVQPHPGNGLFPVATPARPRPEAPVRQWSPVAVVATLLLVAMALIVSSLFFISRPRAPDTLPAIAPAATPATPDASPGPAFWPATHSEPMRPADVERLWTADIPEETARRLVPQITVDPEGRLWVIDGGSSRFVIVEPDGAATESWGEAGTGPGQFDFQREDGAALGGIAFRPSGTTGDFYVADSQNARIQQFAADRTLIRTWGEPGTADGQFLEPIGVSVGPNGNVYVVDHQRADVQVFSPDGQFLRAFGGPGREDGQLAQPGWATFDADGRLWVADTGNGRLQAFDGEGRHQLTIDSTALGKGVIDQPEAVATDRDGRVYVTDRNSHRIQVFNSEGRWLIALGYHGGEIGGYGGTQAVVTPYQDPAGLAIAADNTIYVLDADTTAPSVQKFQLVLPEMRRP